MSDTAILLTTYNGEKYVSELLRSLANQTYQDFVCYIHDDGSVDNTVALCKAFCGEHEGQFVILDYPGTGGAKNNFFSLLERVESDYYLFCDQDDFWLPDKIEKMLRVAQTAGKNTRGQFVYSDLKIVDDKLITKSESFFSSIGVKTDKIDYKNSLIKGYIPGCAMLIDRVLRNKIIRYKNLDHIIMHDWWIVIAALLDDIPLQYVNEPLVLYRQHANNTIGAQELSTIDRIKVNLKCFTNSKFRTEKKQNIIVLPRLQALELYETGLGSGEKRKFLRQYYEIGSRTKLYRICFYLKNFRYVHRLWWILIWV